MYKEECVLKNKIFHPSVMYYILSTIVYPLSPTYPINLKSETMHKITLNVPDGILQFIPCRFGFFGIEIKSG